MVEAANGSALKTEAIDSGALTAFAARGLVSMFDPERQMFCHRLRQIEGRLVTEGISQRYTVMTLLGLYRFEAAGGEAAIQTSKVLASLFADYAWVNNLGDLGLLLWLCALVCPERFDAMYSAFRVDSSLERFPEAREGHTMDLSWFLSGLAHAALALPAKRQALEGLAVSAYVSLKKNQGRQGLFGHQAKGSLSSLLRRRIGSFADQVYPIYAASRFAQAYQRDDALDTARNCATAICQAQGPLGQWWWHYDSLSGKVIQRYPVYSVHQDGMAPMALLALSEASGLDYTGPIQKGLAWINGVNELGRDLQDRSSNVIWRSIYRKSSTAYLREFSNFVRSKNSARTVKDLEVLHECRPYHLGWLLYALAPSSIR